MSSRPGWRSGRVGKAPHLLILLLCCAAAAHGHHGAFEYDKDKLVTYEGVVAEVRWVNPHTLIYVDTRSPDNRTTRLAVEGGGPSSLLTVGVRADSVAVGDHVVIVASPHRDQPDRAALGREMIKEDGTSVPLAPTYARADRIPDLSPAESVIGTWVPTSFFHMVLSRESLPFTPNGRQMFDSYDVSMSSASRCVPSSVPWLMSRPMVVELEALPDRIAMHMDFMGAERVVYLDGRAHPPTTERFPQGHSVGHWENDTLVIDTRNFEPRETTEFIGSSPNKHLVERLSLTSDRKHLEYHYVLEDPEYLASPASDTFSWDHRPDLTPSGIPCDMEVAARYLKGYR